MRALQIYYKYLSKYEFLDHFSNKYGAL